ncbi:MAG: AAA family ATPase, partial [Actinomycetota bacterium]
DGDAVVVGLGGEDVVPAALAVEDGARMVVAGPAGSGRSTALAVLGQGLRRAGRPVAVVAPRASPLVALAPDVPAVTDVRDVDGLRQLCRPLGPGRPVVLVDDVGAVEGSAAEDVLLEHLADGGGVVVAGDPTELGSRFRGLAAEARRGRTGLLLSPTGYADGDVLGVAVRRAGQVRPGRGYLVRRGAAVPVQVALPEAPATARAC